MTDITTLPAGTAVTLTLKGDAALVQGTIVGPYTRDVMPAVLIHTGRDRDYPEVAVPLHTIADVHVHGDEGDVETRTEAWMDRYDAAMDQHTPRWD